MQLAIKMQNNTVSRGWPKIRKQCARLTLPLLNGGMRVRHIREAALASCLRYQEPSVKFFGLQTTHRKPTPDEQFNWSGIFKQIPTDIVDCC